MRPSLKVSGKQFRISLPEGEQDLPKRGGLGPAPKAVQDEVISK